MFFSDTLGGDLCKLLPVSFVIRLILLHGRRACVGISVLRKVGSSFGAAIRALRVLLCVGFAQANVPGSLCLPLVIPELVPNSSPTYKSFTAYIGRRRYVPLHD